MKTIKLTGEQIENLVDELTETKLVGQEKGMNFYELIKKRSNDLNH